MFRFTIRDVLWFMVVVAMCLALLAASHRAAFFEARCQDLERAKTLRDALEQEYLKRIHELETATNASAPWSRKAITDDK